VSFKPISFRRMDHSMRRFVCHPISRTSACLEMPDTIVGC
jgi:hypothetical protein